MPSPISVQEWLAAVKKYEREGELFRAYDLAMQASEEWPEDVALKHRAVLCLASTGATAQAAAQFERQFTGLATEALDPAVALDIATLHARLLKDAALTAGGSERRTRLVEAAAAYGAAYRAAKNAGLREAYYPGINCATMHLLAGGGATAAALASEILAALSAWPTAAKGYYEFATEAEAHLILGDTLAAREAAHQARAGNRLGAAANFRDLASTIRQLRRIAEACQLDAAWLDEFTPPRVVHYVGHIISAPSGSGRFPATKESEVAAAVAAALDAVDIGSGYGSLAAGADILFAEALLVRGANLNVVLPFALDEFIELSVRPAGGVWVERFHACLDRAATVRYATEERYLDDDFLFGYCGELAMGLAVLRARHLLTSVEQIAVWDGDETDGPAGTAHDVAVWRRAGLPQRLIPIEASAPPPPPPPRAADNRMPRRRTCAMLFADVKAFSVLRDEHLPRFLDSFLGAFARVVDRFAGDVLFANTWGDGLFLVFGNAGAAARCALALQQEVAGIDRAEAGLPGSLGLRIGGHLGPAYAARDPILKRRNFFGSHVSRTARIEPVTPENCIYVTETLAAALALENPDEFQCNYVGMTDAAKRYGKMRMFLLDAASAADHGRT